jgi:hypothetical protein
MYIERFASKGYHNTHRNSKRIAPMILALDHRRLSITLEIPVLILLVEGGKSQFDIKANRIRKEALY